MQFTLKLLSRSDLTFFARQLRLQNAGKQKAINLNADVFVDLLFPAAREAANGMPRQFPVPVHIYGPGLRSAPHIVMRKVIAAGGSQKNWRLNGETVPDPDDDPTRYHGLAQHDLAVIGFDGTEGLPSAVHMVLLSRSEPADAALIQQLAGRVTDRRSMLELSASEVAGLAASSPADHPLRELAEDDRDSALIEAVEGSADAVLRLLRRPSSRRMTFEAFAKARASAEANGRQGEELVHVWLEKEVRDGRLLDVTWSSDDRPLNPWDFEVTEASGTKVRIEVKATSGPFDRKFHISQAEVIAAADPNAPRTDLYRVFELTDGGGRMCISAGIAPIADGILKAASALGAGIEPDGYTIEPGRITKWSQPVTLAPDDTPE